MLVNADDDQMVLVTPHPGRENAVVLVHVPSNPRWGALHEGCMRYAWTLSYPEVCHAVSGGTPERRARMPYPASYDNIPPVSTGQL
ncbi:MAG: hypothetical protein ACYCW6_06120, partial [Candidatus Xenobia bacterium]